MRPLALLLAAALIAAHLGAAAPARAQAPDADADALYERLLEQGPAASYWRALDQAFPDEGPRLLARALQESPDLDRAVVATLVEADRLPWEEPQLMMQAPVEKLMAQQRALAGVYVAALNDNVGPCADSPERRELSSEDVERAWRRYRLAVMQAAAAGRLEPVRRARAGASDQAFYEAAYRELRAQAGVPPNPDLRRLPRPEYCRAQIAAFAALERLRPDAAARMAAHMVDAAADLGAD